MNISNSIKVLSLGLAVLFSSANFASDDIVSTNEVDDYVITLTQEPTIIDSVFYGSTVNCSGDFSQYSAKIEINEDGLYHEKVLQIVSGQRFDCRAVIVRDFELDLDLYINHHHQDSHEYYNSLPLSNIISNPYGE